VASIPALIIGILMFQNTMTLSTLGALDGSSDMVAAQRSLDEHICTSMNRWHSLTQQIRPPSRRSHDASPINLLDLVLKAGKYRLQRLGLGTAATLSQQSVLAL
jgi:hypothetical protein